LDFETAAYKVGWIVRMERILVEVVLLMTRISKQDWGIRTLAQGL